MSHWAASAPPSSAHPSWGPFGSLTRRPGGLGVLVPFLVLTALSVALVWTLACPRVESRAAGTSSPWLWIQAFTPEGQSLISERLPVESDGMVTLPDGGRVLVASRSDSAVEKDLSIALSTRAVVNPVVRARRVEAVSVGLQGPGWGVPSGPQLVERGTRIRDLLDHIPLAHLADVRRIGLIRDGRTRTLDLISSSLPASQEPDDDAEDALQEGDRLSLPTRDTAPDRFGVCVLGSVPVRGWRPELAGRPVAEALDQLTRSWASESPAPTACRVVRGWGHSMRMYRIPLARPRSGDSWLISSRPIEIETSLARHCGPVGASFAPWSSASGPAVLRTYGSASTLSLEDDDLMVFEEGDRANPELMGPLFRVLLNLSPTDPEVYAPENPLDAASVRAELRTR